MGGGRTEIGRGACTIWPLIYDSSCPRVVELGVFTALLKPFLSSYTVA